jgi:hypothetical protein
LPTKKTNQKNVPKKKTVPVFRHLRKAIFRSKKQSPVLAFFGLPPRTAHLQYSAKHK